MFPRKSTLEDLVSSFQNVAIFEWVQHRNKKRFPQNCFPTGWSRMEMWFGDHRIFISWIALIVMTTPTFQSFANISGGVIWDLDLMEMDNYWCEWNIAELSGFNDNKRRLCRNLDIIISKTSTSLCFTDESIISIICMRVFGDR